MMKLLIEISGNSAKAEMEGVANNKQELYALIGMLEDMKFKILSQTQDDGSTKSFFAIDKKKKQGD